MRIAYLAAGAAGMYCGSCLHDNTLAAQLIAEGDDVLLIPTYTPLRTDEPSVAAERIFYGGINVYLQQKMSLFRHTPWWLDRLLDSPSVLNFVTRGAASTEPAKLGDLTTSVLAGEAGRQAKELEKLVQWLESEVKPDVVHLSNAMLLGMARVIKRRLGVPVVCSLSGEDIFLERLEPPFYEQARQLLRERSQDASAFIALNRYYGAAMADYLEVEAERIHVIPHGLNLEGHAERIPTQDPATITIGFMARVCHDKGLHLLADALIELAGDPSLPEVHVKAAGYLGSADRPYLADIQERIAAAGLADRFTYLGEPDRAGKIALLQSLDIKCLPTVYRESKGLPILEAWANGVPVVVPNHGSFPEMVADTDGGLLFDPEDVNSLVAALKKLIEDRELSVRLGQQGRSAVLDRYHSAAMARQTRELYQRLIDVNTTTKGL